MPELPPPYRLIRPLGRGGMAMVQLAWHDGLGQEVAVKMLAMDDRGRFASSTLTAIREEAAMLGRLRHPGIPRLYEHIDLDTVKAIVMEYVAGDTLEAVTRRAPRPHAAILLDWTRQLCGVLGYLHGLQPPVIFRDLKPANVIVAEDGTPAGRLVLIDFGIAKVLDEQLKRSTQTTARGVLTRGFAAVEQYIGGTDARSDIYALGATLHALASGATPPESLAIATGKATLADLAGLRPDLPAPLLDAIGAMTRLDRALRPQSVTEVMRLIGLEPHDAPPTEWTRPSLSPTHDLAGGACEPWRCPARDASLLASDGPPTEQTDGSAFVPDHPAAWRPPA